MAANMWKNSLKNVESDNNKILYETLLDLFYSETVLTVWISLVYINNTCLWQCLGEFFIEWKMFQSRWENRNTHYMFDKPASKIVPILRENIAELGRPLVDNTTRRKNIKFRITKTKNTHSEYVILIAFPRQHRLCERASVLRYTCIAYVFCNRDGVCLLRGTNWIQNKLRLILVFE